MERLYSYFKNPVWVRVLLFSCTLFFIRFADSIIAFWVPNQIENTLQNPVVMGMIVSFQSVVGIVADLIFPKLLKSVSVRRLVFWSILAAALTSFFLASTVVKPFMAIFIVTMAAWGIYYELVNFASFQFMGSAVPANMRTGAWGIAGVSLSLAYFLGPLLAAELLLKGYLITQGAIVVFLFCAWLLLTLFRPTHDISPRANITELNPITEFKHWLTLSGHIWPILTISIVLGFIDATFYTVGTVWTLKLAEVNPWGVWLLSFYLLPFICIGFPLSYMNINNGKKKLAEIFLGISGIFFSCMAIFPDVSWQLAMVSLAACGLAVCYPMLQGAYSDLIARMGKEKKEMIGLTSSATNIAYVIWPTIAGLISLKVGERMTFSYLGMGIIVVSIILLLVTPKKLILPQKEIKSWK